MACVKKLKDINKFEKTFKRFDIPYSIENYNNGETILSLQPHNWNDNPNKTITGISECCFVFDSDTGLFKYIDIGN